MPPTLRQESRGAWTKRHVQIRHIRVSGRRRADIAKRLKCRPLRLAAAHTSYELLEAVDIDRRASVVFVVYVRLDGVEARAEASARPRGVAPLAEYGLGPEDERAIDRHALRKVCRERVSVLNGGPASWRRQVQVARGQRPLSAVRKADCQRLRLPVHGCDLGARSVLHAQARVVAPQNDAIAR